MDNQDSRVAETQISSASSSTTPFPPKNYFVESLLVTTFCCWPLGVVALVYSTQIESLYAMGQYDLAQKASEKAKKFLLWGVGIGLGVFVLYVLFAILYGVALASSLGGARY